MDKKVFMAIMMTIIILITLYSATSQETTYDNQIFVYEKIWKVGKTQTIEVYPDKEYIKADIVILDSDNKIIKKDIMYSPDEEYFTYNYFVSTNTPEDRYTINITLDDFYENENIVFQVNVEQLSIFEKAWVFITSHIPQIDWVVDRLERFIY